MKNHSNSKPSVLLTLLPYWTPQIPPMGIACLKSFLAERGYEVSIVDANTDDTFNELYHHYVDKMRGWIPAEHQGNFYNVGQEVLENHLTALLNRQEDEDFFNLLGLLVKENFYVELERGQLEELDTIASGFYTLLDDYVTRLLEQENPDVLGLSVFRGNLGASLAAARLARKVKPAVKTVMGGAIFSQSLGLGTPDLDYFLQTSEGVVDALIIGEGEHLFHQWLDGHIDGEKRVVTQADSNGTLLDLSSAPLPDYSGLDLTMYPHIAHYGSRSCPFECSFCSETKYWGKYRKKEVPQLTGELTDLSRAHKSQLVLMCDSLLNPVISPLAQEMERRDDALYIDGYLRVCKESLDPETVYQWRRGGFYRARLGIESGSPHVLQLMEKRISVDEIKQSLRNLADAGIKTTTYWVMGHPGETEEDFMQTLALIQEMKDEIYEAWCSTFHYFPTGQVNSNEWSAHSRLLYPETYRPLLISLPEALDLEPTRQEAFRRMNRFVEHCRNLGIPNPYTMREFHQADNRWRQLHRNAVPPLVDFENPDRRIDECKSIRQPVAAHTDLPDDGDFGF